MIPASESRLLVALAASLAVHALVITSMRGPQPSPVLVPAPLLEVELAKEEPAPQAQHVPVAPAVADERTSRTTHERRMATQQKAQQPLPPSPSSIQPSPAIPTPVQTEIPVVSMSQEQPAIVSRESPALAARVTPSAPSAAPAQNEVRVDTRQALLAYGRLLSQAIAREQRYPPVARENGWQGTVEIALEVAGNRLRDVTIVRSSGYGVLDQRAVEMARAVAPLPPLPEALARQDFKVQVPITFRLQD